MAKDADNAVDVARAVDKPGDVVKAADKAEDLYTTAKVDGTIQGFLDAVDDPIAEMGKMSGSIAKTSPMQIPESATIKPQIKNEYYQIRYKWTDSDGYFHEGRWHTRNPTAPEGMKDVWIIERGVKGIGYGANAKHGFSEILVVPNMWVDRGIWEDALKARKKQNITKELEEILNYGHWKA